MNWINILETNDDFCADCWAIFPFCGAYKDEGPFAVMSRLHCPTGLRTTAQDFWTISKGTVMKLEGNTILQASPHVRSITTADGAALLDIHAGVCYSLNPVGATIWEQIQLNTTGIGIDAILLHLERTCSVGRGEIRDDILAYLRSLEDRSLVICRSNGSSPPQ